MKHTMSFLHPLTDLVAPCAGAWVETAIAIKADEMPYSRPLCGGVG